MSSTSPVLTLDPLAFSLRAVGGVSRVWRTLLHRLVASDIAIRFTGGMDGRDILKDGLDAVVGASERVDRIPAGLRRFISYGGEGNVFFPTYFRPCRPGIPNIQLVHDCIKELYYPVGKAALARWRKRRIYRNASRLIAISEATRFDLLRLHGEWIEDRIRVIRNPVDREHLLRCAVSGAGYPEFDRLRTHIDGRPYAMFIGYRGSWKNFREVRTLLGALKEHVVLAVGPSPAPDEIHLAEDFGGRIVFAVGLPDEVMFTLLAQSQFLFFPSMLEGFGLPIIESLYVGTPVLGLDTQVNREISLGLVQAFESGSQASIRSAVERMRRPEAGSPALQRLIARYDPESVARAYLSVIREIL